jgi:hypothetical protein
MNSLTLPEQQTLNPLTPLRLIFEGKLLFKGLDLVRYKEGKLLFVRT